MPSATIRYKILTIPGLHNSGPTHWQSLWEHKFADAERIELGRWSNPDKDEWVKRIADAVEAAIVKSPMSTLEPPNGTDDV